MGRLPTLAGLPLSALRSQWNEMKQGLDVEAAEQELPTWPSSPALNASGLVTQDILERKARSIGITLVRRGPRPVSDSSDIPTLSKAPKRKRSSYAIDSGISGIGSSTDHRSVSDDEATSRPDSRPIVRRIFTTPRKDTRNKLYTGLLSPPSTKKSKRYAPLAEFPKIRPLRNDTLQTFASPSHDSLLNRNLAKNYTHSRDKSEPGTPKRVPRLGFRAFSAASQGLNSASGFRRCPPTSHLESAILFGAVRYDSGVTPPQALFHEKRFADLENIIRFGILQRSPSHTTFP